MENIFGFKPAKRSTTRWPRLKDPESDIVFICYKNNKNEWRYMVPELTTGGGLSIIDLIFYKYPHYNFGQVRGYLDNYLGKDHLIPSNSNYNQEIPSKSDNYLLHHINELQPYEDRSFLHKKGINDETIDHPYFKPIIFNKPYYSEKNKTTFQNTAFIMSSFDEKYKAIALRNKNFKGVLGKRGSAICASANKEKNIDKLIVCETMDDCMAHFQLNKNELKDKSIRYIATQGTITDPNVFNQKIPDNIDKQITSRQTELINQVIQKQKPKEIEIGFDNDLQGAFFSNILIGKLNLPQSYYEDQLAQSIHPDTRFIFDSVDKHNFYIIPKSTDKDINPISYLENLNQNEFDNLFTITQIDKDNAKFYKLQLPEYTHLEGKHIHDQLSEFFIKAKFGPNRIVQRTNPLTKDFGDDLQAYKGINKQHMIQPLKGGTAITYYQFLNSLTDSQIQQLTHISDNIESYSVSKFQNSDNLKEWELNINGNPYIISSNQVYKFAKNNDLILSKPMSDLDKQYNNLKSGLSL